METLATVTVAFLVGGTIKGVTGMGLPTVSVAIMGGVLVLLRHKRLPGDGVRVAV